MTSPTDLPFNIQPPGTPAEPSLREQVTALLEGFGLEVETDTEGDLTYQVSEQQLYTKVSEEGDGFVRVFGQWRMAEGLPGGPIDWYAAAARVSMELPLVKVIVVQEGLVVASDMVAPAGGRLDVALRLGIEHVLHGVNHWHQYLFEQFGVDPETGQAQDPQEPAG